MIERKEIGSISIVTDTETGVYHMGEVEGGFNISDLKEYVRKYGHLELIEKLAFMQWQVLQVKLELDKEFVDEINDKINDILKKI